MESFSRLVINSWLAVCLNYSYAKTSYIHSYVTMFCQSKNIIVYDTHKLYFQRLYQKFISRHDCDLQHMRERKTCIYLIYIRDIIVRDVVHIIRQVHFYAWNLVDSLVAIDEVCQMSIRFVSCFADSFSLVTGPFFKYQLVFPKYFVKKDTQTYIFFEKKNQDFILIYNIKTHTIHLQFHCIFN